MDLETDTVPTTEIIEVVETAAERAVREDQEKAVEKEREQTRWRVTGDISEHLKRLSVCLDMLLETEPKDKATLAALALRMRTEYLAALDLVPAHKAVGGYSYDSSLRLFENLYR